MVDAKSDFKGEELKLVQFAEKTVEEFKNSPDVAKMRFLTHADDNARAWMEDGDVYIRVLDLIEKQTDKLLSGVDKVLPTVHEDLNGDEMKQLVFSFGYMQGCVFNVAKQMKQKEDGDFSGSLKGEYLKSDLGRVEKLFMAMDECKNLIIGRTPLFEGSCSYLKEMSSIPFEERSGIAEFNEFLNEGSDSQVYEAAHKVFD